MPFHIKVVDLGPMVLCIQQLMSHRYIAIVRGLEWEFRAVISFVLEKSFMKIFNFGDLTGPKPLESGHRN